MIDTNVLIVANGRNTHADLRNAARCAARLQSVRLQGVVIDQSHQVLREYERYCNHSGQPGPGDQFLRWLMQSSSTSLVKWVGIPLMMEGLLERLPEALWAFDPADVKWLVLFIEGDAKAIINASDSDYRERNQDLSDAGIVVEELCPELLEMKEM